MRARKSMAPSSLCWQIGPSVDLKLTLDVSVTPGSIKAGVKG